jgi:hypothetical protein
MTWRNTTTEKPANSVDVLGWTGERFVVASYYQHPAGSSEEGHWITEDYAGDNYHYLGINYIKSWMPLTTAPASAPVSPKTPARE